MEHTYTSLAHEARNTIVRKNPFPSLPGLPSNAYGCKWGLTDLYPEDEAILRAAIDARKTFDTGWIGCKKEIRSFRMISDGKLITIQASAEMDEFPDLIYDALDDDVELTEEQVETLEEYWYNDTEMFTEVESERTVPVTTYKDAMMILEQLEDANDRQLNAWFEVVKQWVKDVVSAT